MNRAIFTWLTVINLFVVAPVQGETAEVTIRPDDDIQAVLNRAAAMDPKPTIRFAAGTYFPKIAGQALFYLNKKHDGLVLEGDGQAILSAENKQISDRAAYSYPAVVNHVIYLGDGLTGKTRISGFKITGARGFVTRLREYDAEPNRRLIRKFVFYSDGGAIKIFGKSSPVLENLEIADNRTLLCGAGISIEQMGLTRSPVVIRNVRFKNNQTTLTGAAIDLLPGSHAEVSSSHFVENKANQQWLAPEVVGKARRSLPGVSADPVVSERFHRSSAVTVFAGSSLVLKKSNFTGNSGGVDYNDYVDWYWTFRGLRPAEVKSKVIDTAFQNNRYHGVKSGSDWLLVQ